MESVRLAEWKRLHNVLQDTRATVIFEALAWKRSCTKSSIRGIPAWIYSNGSTLFETNRPEEHAREVISSYLEGMENAHAVVADPVRRQKVIQDPYSEDWAPGAAHEVTEGQYAEWRALHAANAQESKRVLEERTSAAGDFIKCRKCGSNEIDTEQKQTRSADEPMTVFCCCRVCGKRFTM